MMSQLPVVGSAELFTAEPSAAVSWISGNGTGSTATAIIGSRKAIPRIIAIARMNFCCVRIHLPLWNYEVCHGCFFRRRHAAKRVRVREIYEARSLCFCACEIAGRTLHGKVHQNCSLARRNGNVVPTVEWLIVGLNELRCGCKR